MFERVDEVQLVAGLDAVAAEVHDDVVALRDALGRELALVFIGVPVGVEIQGPVEGDRVFHDVAVVGDHVEGDPVIGDPGVVRASHLSVFVVALAHQRDREVAGHRAVQDAEAVAARSHLEVGIVQPVGEQVVAQEPVDVEDVEPELAGLVPGLVGDHQVDVVVAVAPGKRRPAGEAEVDPVIEVLLAAVERAVVVHHHGVALVDVLGREIEHVVVEPVGAHRLAPVAADLDGPVDAGFRDHGIVRGIVDEERLPRRARERGPGIGRVRVDAVVPGELDRPAVVEELPREEEGVGVAVALGRGVAVVLVGGDRVQPEPAVRRRVDRQRVVMAH